VGAGSSSGMNVLMGQQRTYSNSTGLLMDPRSHVTGILLEFHSGYLRF
jgi:hypothetical protein